MREVLKEVAPGVFTHSHWIDNEGNVIPDENIVIPTSEYEKMKQDLADTKACIDEILMGV